LPAGVPSIVFVDGGVTFGVPVTPWTPPVGALVAAETAPVGVDVLLVEVELALELVCVTGVDEVEAVVDAVLVDPVVEAVVDSVVEAVVDAVLVDPVVEAVVDSVVEAVVDSVVEAVVDSVVEAVVDSVVEAVVEVVEVVEVVVTSEQFSELDLLGEMTVTPSELTAKTIRMPPDGDTKLTVIGIENGTVVPDVLDPLGTVTIAKFDSTSV